MATVEEIVLTYVAAWAEIDEEKRRPLLEKSWEENGIYADPTGEAVGREALNHRIEGFHQQRFPGHRLLLTSGVDAHHGLFRFTWTMVNPEGNRIMEGVDFGEVGADGRLIRITGFFSQPSPIPSSWPTDLVLANKQTTGSGN